MDKKSIEKERRENIEKSYTELNGYQFDEEIGHGGFGAVVKVKKDNRDYAAKLCNGTFIYW
jgi:hypothetical protein